MTGSTKTPPEKGFSVLEYVSKETRNRIPTAVNPIKRDSLNNLDFVFGFFSNFVGLFLLKQLRFSMRKVYNLMLL